MPRGAKPRQRATVASAVEHEATCDAGADGAACEKDTGPPVAEAAPAPVFADNGSDEPAAAACHDGAVPLAKKKRGVNGYIVFSQQQRSLSTEKTSVTFAAKEIGERWRALGDDEKAKYAQLAKERNAAAC